MNVTKSKISIVQKIQDIHTPKEKLLLMDYEYNSSGGKFSYAQAQKLKELCEYIFKSKTHHTLSPEYFKEALGLFK